MRRNGQSVGLIRAGPTPIQNCDCQADGPPFPGDHWRGKRRYISRTARMNVLWGEPTSLLLEHFFDLSDLFLNFAGVFFDVAFGL